MEKLWPWRELILWTLSCDRKRFEGTLDSTKGRQNGIFTAHDSACSGCTNPWMLLPIEHSRGNHLHKGRFEEKDCSLCSPPRSADNGYLSQGQVGVNRHQTFTQDLILAFTAHSRPLFHQDIGASKALNLSAKRSSSLQRPVDLFVSSSKGAMY